jgi:uncharacterized protein YbjT (DUF2867 family)
MAEELVHTNRLVTVFGGSGFIGRHVVRALAQAGWRVRVAVRRPELAFHLQPLGAVGQIQAVQTNLRYRESILPALQGAQAAVNLVGILRKTSSQTFDAVHHAGAQAFAEAAKEAGTEKIVHISAIGADTAHPSSYARSKALGEKALREARPDAIILRPSVVFGPEDQFFNRFASLARFSPALPLIGGGGTKFQPVFAGDVAAAVACAVDGRARAGVTYELGGPEVATFRAILEFILATIGRKRWLVPIPFELAETLAFFSEVGLKLSFGLLPDTFVITRDQVALLKSDNIVSDEAIAEGRTLPGLGISPEAYEAFVPSYLYRYRKTGQFANPRAVL